MRYLYATLLWFLMLFSLKAQEDSIFQKTPEKYDSVYKSFIKDKEKDIRHVWKLSLVDLAWARFSIGYEQKIGTSWSSESFLKAGLAIKNDLYEGFPEWEISQRFKYYYNIHRREKLGRKTNGFSGNYIAIGLFAGENHFFKPAENQKLFTDKFSYYGAGIYYGMQRRMGNFGYIEPYAGLLFQNQSSSANIKEASLFTFKNNNYHKWTINPEFGFRAGFYLDQSWRTSVETSTGKSQLKINLTDIGFMHINVGFEWKLAENFTSDIYFSGGLVSRPSVDSANQSRLIFEGPLYLKAEIEEQIRYYHNFKRRRETGHNISGFSGNYLALSLVAGMNENNYDDEITGATSGGTYISMTHYSIGLRYGIQRRIGNAGFVDVFAGFGYNLQEYPVFNISEGFTTLNKKMKNSIKPIIGIRAGIALGRSSDIRKITD